MDASPLNEHTRLHVMRHNATLLLPKARRGAWPPGALVNYTPSPGATCIMLEVQYGTSRGKRNVLSRQYGRLNDIQHILPAAIRVGCPTTQRVVVAILLLETRGAACISQPISSKCLCIKICYMFDNNKTTQQHTGCASMQQNSVLKSCCVYWCSVFKPSQFECTNLFNLRWIGQQ